MSVALALYRAAWAVGIGLRLPSLLLRGKAGELAERCGRVPAATPGALWIHAASVGEMRAAESLMRELRAGGAGAIALTAVTRTGRERAASLHPDVGPHHVPLDAPGPVRSFLERIRPRSLVILETELWPNLLLELGRRGIPWAVASGRISPRTVRRTRLARSLARRVLRGAACIGCRTPADAERFLKVGARPETLRVTGDLKEDREVPPWTEPPSGRWIAACTRPGEEADVLEALRRVADRHPRGELLLAPRHPERFDEAARLVESAGFPLHRWSRRDEAAANGPGWSVLLVDEMNVLDDAYREAACAFVGGSLRPFGGHSPLEAAAAGRAVLCGPHTETCAAHAERLAGAGGLERVTTAGDLARAVSALLADPDEAARRGRAAHAVAGELSGAGRATVALLREHGVIPS